MQASGSFPPFETIDDPVRFHARERPDDLAMIDEERSWTYADADAQADRWAHALARTGIEAGDRVGLIGYDTAPLVLAAFGIARRRAVLVAVNPKLVVAEVRFMLKDAGARWLVVDAAWREGAEELLASVATLEGVTVLEDSEVFLGTERSGPFTCPAQEDDLVSLNYTSGTTGKPKGVMLAHRSFFAVRRALADAGDPWIGWSTEDRSLSCIPFFHIGGIWWVMTTLVSGATLRLVPTFDARRVLDVMEHDRITKVCMVPAMLGMCLADPTAASRDHDALETIVYGGSPIPVSVLREGLEVFGCGFAQIYGLTETGNTAVCLRPEDHGDARPDLARAAGRPYPGLQAKVVDEAGHALEAGETGEICLRSPANMLGYWNRPEATAETLRDGWIHTGDGGTIDAEGYVFVGDRLKDMIIRAGENIFPAEIESALVQHEDVAEAGVLGRPDARWGETVVAVVVPVAGRTPRVAAIIRHLRGRIASFKFPTEIRFADSLPRTASGKIQKHELRRWWEAGGEASAGG